MSFIKRLPAHNDFLLSLSGFCLSLFLATHLVFDATILFGPSVFNNVPKMLHSIYLAQIFTPVVVAGFFIHFCIAVRKIPVKSSELQRILKLSIQTRHRDTMLWLLQCITGLFLLLAGTLHFWIILTDGIKNINAVSSSNRAALPQFHVFYYIFMCTAILHSGIGMYRISIKWAGKGRKIIFALMLIICTGYGIMSIMTINRFNNRGEMQAVLKQRIIYINSMIDNNTAVESLNSELMDFHKIMDKLQLKVSPELFENLGITYDEKLYLILKKTE
ncbi:MAG: hypothetical protein JW982_08765 [Spirochaetes bacterium]|nr:hypothetical protein [Spirochaetota bacterium]